MRTDWSGDDAYHHRVHATFTTATAEGPVIRELTGDVINLIPLRNRRDGRVTRISEGMTRWTLDVALGTDAEATTGHGLSEYLDQIVDGAPVGIDE